MIALLVAPLVSFGQNKPTERDMLIQFAGMNFPAAEKAVTEAVAAWAPEAVFAVDPALQQAKVRTSMDVHIADLKEMLDPYGITVVSLNGTPGHAPGERMGLPWTNANEKQDWVDANPDAYEQLIQQGPSTPDHQSGTE